MSLGPRARAVLRQRCPVCLEGPMFARRLQMNEVCPTCGHRFIREQGFFQGAMYVSYVLATALFLVLAWTAYFALAPRIGLLPAVGSAVVLHLAAVPVIFRYSRVIWSHLMLPTLEPPPPPGPVHRPR